MLKIFLLIAILLSCSAGFADERNDSNERAALTGYPGTEQVSPALQASSQKAPEFKDYPVAETFKGTPVAPKIVSAESRKFQKMIRDGAKGGPNFAGHFTIAQWGCGGGCVQFAIIDARTGVVYNPKFYIAQGVETSDEPLQYHKDSSLLIATGNRNEEEKEGVYYYAWQAGTLKLIATLPVKHDKKPDDK